MSGWQVYILECGDGTLYTGIAVDLGRRVDAHQRGTASKYTRARLPVKLIYQEAHPTRSGALRRESLIKKMERRDKLRLLDRRVVPHDKGQTHG
ncbi:MAG: GIY-YIG nuclease family protein [Candidatus Polarisedimenticolia bacterium]